MRKTKTPKIKPLYVLNEEERKEVVLRRRLLNDALYAYQAAALYVDQFDEFLRTTHDLPDKFDLDMDTGHITPRAPSQNGSEPNA